MLFAHNRGSGLKKKTVQRVIWVNTHLRGSGKNVSNCIMNVKEVIKVVAELERSKSTCNDRRRSKSSSVLTKKYQC
jgi:hypothetical protein